MLAASVVLAGCSGGACDVSEPKDAGATIVFDGTLPAERMMAILNETGWDAADRGTHVQGARLVDDPPANATSPQLVVSLRTTDEGTTRLSTVTTWPASDREDARAILSPHLDPLRARLAQELGEPVAELYEGGGGCRPTTA